MICDFADKIDFRELRRSMGRPLPDTIWFKGERFVMEWTDTAFGGRRQWVLCPSCDRRCAIVYRDARGKRWGCRICMNGRYRTEHRSPKDRRRLKAFKVRRKLGQQDNNLGKPFPEKPHHMHWRTYEAIKGEALRRECEIIQEAARSVLGE